MLWYLAQSLWALPETAPERAARLSDHAVKALREAKETSSWTAPDTRHEAEVAAFARALAADAGLAAPLAPLEDLARRLALVQLGLKLTMPGIPDIYQGCEIGCAALTDPDNRRPVDFAALAAALEAPHRLPPQDRDKLDLTRRLLHLRRRLPGLFLSGDVQPAAATDGVEAGVIAFHRSHGPHRLTVLAAPAPGGGRVAPAGRRLWGSGDLAREGLAIWLEGPEPATDPAEG
jgi:(1->4)-alpha-D-glucan 1-alpha-D-glucosylmutase